MPTKTAETAVTELALSLGLLMRRIRSAAPAEAHALSWTQRAVLARLERDGPATTAELARAEGVKPQSMGAAIAALEALGWIERTPHPTDGRQVKVALTPTGAAMRQRVTAAKLAWLTEAVARLDAGERATLFAATRIIKRLVQS